MLAREGEFWVDAERRVSSGSSRKAGDKGAFVEFEIFGFFAKVDFGGGLDAPRGAAVGDVVEIHFENLIFGVEDFGADGEDGFFDFSLDGSFWCEEGGFD